MEARPSRSRWLGICLFGLAAALAAVSILGPLLTGAIEWRIRPLIRDQLYGLDALSLCVVTPISVLAGVLAVRQQALAALLGFAPAAYVVYMVPQYVLGPDYTRLPGNNERWFPLLWALFALGVISAALCWSALTADPPAGSARTERLIARRLLPIMAGLVFIRYVPTLADWTSASPKAKDYLAGPSFGWTIALLDLGLALPATVAVCVGHRHGAAWARPGLYALTGWFALVGAAVAAMAIAMQVRHDAAMTVPQMLVMTALGAALITLAAALYVPAVRREVRARRTPPSAATSSRRPIGVHR
jgi:hypothetical protein